MFDRTKVHTHCRAVLWLESQEINDESNFELIKELNYLFDGQVEKDLETQHRVIKTQNFGNDLFLLVNGNKEFKDHKEKIINFFKIFLKTTQDKKSKLILVGRDEKLKKSVNKFLNERYKDLYEIEELNINHHS